MRGLALLAPLLALLLTLGGGAHAQTPQGARAADAALQAWLARELTPDAAAAMQAQGAEAALVQTLRFPPPPAGARPNLELREFVPGEDPAQETYRYPVGTGRGVTDYTVTVQRTEGGGFAPLRVRNDPGETEILPGWMAAPWAGVLFLISSLAFFAFAFQRGWLRHSLGQALRIAREQRAVFIVVNVLLYGAFFIGMAAGNSLPLVREELRISLGQSIGIIGIQNLSANALNFAMGIFSWNFGSGALLTTYLPGLLFGVLAVILNFFRFLVLGLGLSGLPSVALLLHLPTIVIELQAYIFIAASAVAWVLRGFRVGFVPALRDYAYAIPVAALLLLVGAWYEAVELLYLLPLLSP